VLLGITNPNLNSINSTTCPCKDILCIILNWSIFCFEKNTISLDKAVQLSISAGNSTFFSVSESYRPHCLTCHKILPLLFASLIVISTILKSSSFILGPYFTWCFVSPTTSSIELKSIYLIIMVEKRKNLEAIEQLI
jgi:hypothetical protein